jgi:hypothetical protein
MNLKKILIILGIILASIVSLLLLTKLDFDNLLYNYSYRQSQQTPREQNCNDDSDCILVQDTWCKTVLAINKVYKEKWTEQNIKDAQKAKENRQTCKPTLDEYMNIDNFQAVCTNDVCKASFIEDECQKIRDLNTFEETLSISRSLCESCGGDWSPGPNPNGCSPPTSDFGKVCNDNSECEGFCLAVPENSPKAILGECGQYKFVFGCNREVIDGQITAVHCKD